MVQCERSGHRESTCDMKAFLVQVKILWQMLNFVQKGQISMSRSPSQNLWYSVKGVVKRYTHVIYFSTLFQTYLLTLRQINSKNYHFHTFFFAQNRQSTSGIHMKVAISFERRKKNTMKIIKFVLDRWEIKLL